MIRALTTGGSVMTVRDIMSAPAVTISVRCSVGLAAKKMRKYGVGILPIIEGGRIVGAVTDRDIAVRLVPEVGAACDVQVGEIMSRNILSCLDTQAIETAAALMGEHQIRRLPVRDAVGNLVGLLSMGDIAENYSEQLAGETLGEVVEKR